MLGFDAVLRKPEKTASSASRKLLSCVNSDRLRTTQPFIYNSHVLYILMIMHLLCLNENVYKLVSFALCYHP